MWQSVLLLGSEVSGYATLGLTPGDKGFKFFSNCRAQLGSAIREELEAFVARRKAEGGVATDF